MARRAAIRASDTDRETVAEQLRRAAGEGRLRTEELEHRLGAALSALTYGELDAVTADLPQKRSRRRRRRAWSVRVPRGLAFVLAIPVAALALAAVALVVAGVLATWWVWLIVGSLWLGRYRRRRMWMLHWRSGYGSSGRVPWG